MSELVDAVKALLSFFISLAILGVAVVLAVWLVLVVAHAVF